MNDDMKTKEQIVRILIDNQEREATVIPVITLADESFLYPYMSSTIH